jgi:WD40 repeat protein
MAIRSLLFDEYNCRLLSASDDLHINIYNSKDFKILFPLVGHKSEISNIQYNQEKNIYASSSFDGTIKIWDAKLNSKNNCIQTIDLNCSSSINQNNLNDNNTKEENNIIWDINFSNDGKYLMAGSEFGLHIFSC